jgi:Domain of unknown function (DUF6378)
MSIVEQRSATYGSGEENLTRIAALWSAYLGVEITASQCCWMMVLLKASRAKVDAGRDHLDNYVDAHGYLELAERLR